MPHRDPNIIRSGLSQTIVSHGLKADVEIYRLEDGPDWSLVDRTERLSPLEAA